MNKSKRGMVGISISVAGGMALATWWLPSWLRALNHSELSSIEAFGALGDSFAPLGMFFAFLASIGAWLSYATQRDQLRHEQQLSADEDQRHALTYFDGLFFQLMDEYERAIAEDPDRQASLVTFSGLRSSIRRLHESRERNFGSSISELEWFNKKLSESTSEKLVKLSELVCSIVSWLNHSGKNLNDVDLVNHGNILKCRLPKSDLWFWRLAILASGDFGLASFSDRIGLNRQ